MHEIAQSREQQAVFPEVMRAALNQAFTRVRRRPSLSSKTSCITTITSIHRLNRRPIQLLQLQSTFQSYLSPLYYSTNATSSINVARISQQQQQDITRVVDYWFVPTPSAPIPQKWFSPPNRDQTDDEIRSKFEPLIEQARTDGFDSWKSTPLGSLALIVLLDQFPRNIYRGSHLSYASDEKAVDVAVQSIARGYDHAPKLSELQILMLYMPLMHAESLIHQIAGVLLFENLAARCLANGNLSDAKREEIAGFVKRSCGFAKGHRDVVVRFGRFPSRNEAMGRVSTSEEVKFLEENPSGFTAGGSGSE